VRRAIASIILVFVLVSSAWAQALNSDQIYERGDIALRVGVGPLFPLYVHAFDFSNFSMSSMKIGFTLSLGADWWGDRLWQHPWC
jgi:hypothetical protein